MTILNTTVSLGRPGLSRLREKLSGSYRASLFCLLTGLLNLGGSQAIRLGTNLVLTRLLFPEAFGVMALVNVFIIGMDMLSDVGISQSIIRRREALDDAFLQTAWTLQIIRGALLFGGSLILALPVSAFYEMPEILVLLPLIGATRLLVGFRSIAISVSEKQLKPHFHAGLNLTSTVLGSLASITFAWLWQDVLALVAGAWVSAIFYLVASFRIPGFAKHRLRISRPAWQEIQTFGRWILLSTTVAFLGAQGDRLILGKLLSAENLGLYTLAFFFVQAFASLVSGLSVKSLLPLLAADDNPQRRQQIRRMLAWAFCCVPLGLMTLGDDLIDSLYDARYQEAGRYLITLAIGLPPMMLRALSAPVLLARGDSWRRLILSLCETGLLLTATIVGYQIGGIDGFLFGYVLSQYALYPITMALVRRYTQIDLSSDLPFLLLAVSVGAACQFGWL